MTLKLHGVETTKLPAAEGVAEKLKLEVDQLPQGWEQRALEQGKRLTLKRGSTAFEFQLSEGGTVLKSHGNTPAAAGAVAGAGAGVAEDPKVRIAALTRQIAMNNYKIKKLQADSARTGTQSRSNRSFDPAQEQASIQKAIQIVQETNTHLEQLRDKTTREAAAGAAPVAPSAGDAAAQPTTPRGAMLRIVLPNGVCVANAGLSGE
jgi:hypothetical protein